MEADRAPGTADEQYRVAYRAHYVSKNLHTALELYLRVLDSSPDSPEAGYAREQIRNIARSVVPAEELLHALVALARTRLAHVWKASSSPLRLPSPRGDPHEAPVPIERVVR